MCVDVTCILCSSVTFLFWNFIKIIFVQLIIAAI